MWITTCRYHSPSWRANNRLARQEIHCNVWSLKLSHCIHNSPPPICASVRGSIFPHKVYFCDIYITRLRLKRDSTRAETRFRLSAKRTRPFKTARASVQSAIGSRVVRISGSNAGYTMLRGSVKSTGYPLHSPVSPSFLLPCITVCRHISTELYNFLMYGLFCSINSFFPGLSTPLLLMF